jgi:hypothetical protein
MPARPYMLGDLPREGVRPAGCPGASGRIARRSLSRRSPAARIIGRRHEARRPASSTGLLCAAGLAAGLDEAGGRGATTGLAVGLRRGLSPVVALTGKWAQGLEPGTVRSAADRSGPFSIIRLTVAGLPSGTPRRRFRGPTVHCCRWHPGGPRGWKAFRAFFFRGGCFGDSSPTARSRIVPLHPSGRSCTRCTNLPISSCDQTRGRGRRRRGRLRSSQGAVGGSRTKPAPAASAAAGAAANRRAAGPVDRRGRQRPGVLNTCEACPRHRDDATIMRAWLERLRWLLWPRQLPGRGRHCRPRVASRNFQRLGRAWKFVAPLQARQDGRSLPPLGPETREGCSLAPQVAQGSGDGSQVMPRNASNGSAAHRAGCASPGLARCGKGSPRSGGPSPRQRPRTTSGKVCLPAVRSICRHANGQSAPLAARRDGRLLDRDRPRLRCRQVWRRPRRARPHSPAGVDPQPPPRYFLGRKPMGSSPIQGPIRCRHEGQPPG